jgi:hypothetical protein
MSGKLELVICGEAKKADFIEFATAKLWEALIWRDVFRRKKQWRIAMNLDVTSQGAGMGA